MPVSTAEIVVLVAVAAAVALAAALRCRMRAGARRRRVERALHELRRPLQALSLALPGSATAARGHLDRAIEALAGLDAELDGAEVGSRVELVEPERVVSAAVARWRPVAARAGRRLELRWRANGSRVRCDRAAIAAALDNLIGNALEHGAGPIEVEGVVRRGRLRLFVVDGGPALPTAPRPIAGRRPRLAGSARRWRADPRHGHGLRLVAEFASEHGGRFAACRHGAGACAVIELPLAER